MSTLIVLELRSRLEGCRPSSWDQILWESSDEPALSQITVYVYRNGRQCASLTGRSYVSTYLTYYSQNEFIEVSGAGIGGLTLSSTLGFLKVGPEIKIDIYEASSHISEIGAGINMWKRTWGIIRSIGLGDSLLKFLPRPPDDISRACHISRS